MLQSSKIFQTHKKKIPWGIEVLILNLLVGFRSLAERAMARSKWAWSGFSHRLMIRHRQSAANTRVAQRGATKGFDLSSSPSVVNMVSSSISSFFSNSSSFPLLKGVAVLISVTKVKAHYNNPTYSENDALDIAVWRHLI